MNYYVFFDAVRLGEPVDAANAIPAGAPTIAHDLFPLIKEDNEYLGIIDDTRTTLQLMYSCDKDAYWVEVPRPDLGGSYGAYLDFAKTYALLDSLPAEFPKEGFPGFLFKSW